jgi:cytochrome P450
LITESALHNAFLLRSDPLALLSRHAHSGQKIAHIALPGGNGVHLVNEPELVTQILNDQSGAVRKFLPPGVGAVFANGILNSSGDLHRTIRDAAQPLFHRGQLAAWEATISRCVIEVVGDLRRSSNAEVELHRTFQEMMLLLVGRIFFALDLQMVTGELTDCLDEMQRLFRQIDASPRAAERFRESSDHFDALLLDQLRKQPAARASGALFRAFDQSPRGISDHQLRDELRNFMIAGSVTTGVTIAAACAFLAADCGLQHEIRSDASGRPIRDLLDETLRLVPPVWLMLRESIRPFMLGDQPFPASTIFLISPWTLHRSPRHFSAPERFQPTRWRTTGDLPRGLFTPFSLGPRNCVGERFGRQVAERTLTQIVKSFALSPPAAHRAAEWLPRFTLWPDAGVWVILREVLPFA